MCALPHKQGVKYTQPMSAPILGKALIRHPMTPTEIAKPAGPFPITDRVLAAMAVSRRHCEELLPEADWLKKLARSEATGQPLRIKLGLDPTAPDIHIGHMWCSTRCASCRIWDTRSSS